MRKNATVFWILIISLLVASLMAGCAKKQSSPNVSSAAKPTENAAAPVEKPKSIAKSAGPLGDLIQKQMALSSYVMIMDMGGMPLRSSMKLQGGKPVRMKTDMGAMGWMIIQYDKKMQYQYDPNSKTATATPISDATPGGKVPASMSMPSAEQLKEYKVSSETLDGMDCLKVSKEESKMTFWLEKEHGLPVQMMMGEKPMKLKYEKINAVPDSEFELPSGTKVVEAPKAPGQ